MRCNVICKVTALFLAAVMCTGLCTGFTVSAEEMNEEAEAQKEQERQETLENQEEEQSEEQELLETKERRMSSRVSAAGLRAPQIVEDSSMEAEQKVTWDCVWFGSYPQSEVTSSDSLYNTLQNADGWDGNNEITVDGNRYRRMKKGDATYATSGDNIYYDWVDSTTYHYFKYESIKWRVLKIKGNQALLLSDVALDDQRYHTVYEDVTWETSTIRSWLNGYSAASNQRGVDYSGKNFIGSAFTSGEQSAIVNTSVVNADNIQYGTAGGNNTTDKVFLLSESEVYGDSAKVHGFVSYGSTRDEARRCKSSTYAKAMGAFSSTNDVYNGSCDWWLRSPGHFSNYAAMGNYYGSLNRHGVSVSTNSGYGVRAALNLNLSSNQWSYAGTVSSDGTENGMGESSVEKEELEALIDAYSKMPADEYTAETWEPFQKALEEAQLVVDDQDAIQEQVDQIKQELEEAYAALKKSIAGLSEPQIKENSSMEAGQKVTWDCVWFGNYPQSEVTSSDSVYRVLQNAKKWDSKNDIIVNGNRYRRMKKGDATYSSGSSGYYSWSDSNTYHYFKYEPIKWRVLRLDGKQALLLSDMALDDQKYHALSESVTWETSTIRSWLNGYDASFNQPEIDYSVKNFISSAFTSGEQTAITDMPVINADSVNYGTAGGNDTIDKIFLLSESEIYGDSAAAYGFASNKRTKDEARRCKSSTYAKAMGSYNSTEDAYKGNCWWRLRSPGNDTNSAVYVKQDGYVYYYGNYVDFKQYSVRAALKLDLSSDRWSYAGTVSSDGTKDEVSKPVVEKEELIILIEAFSKMSANEYTDETWKPFQKAFKEAQLTVDNLEATQEQVDQAKKELEEAYSALKESDHESVSEPVKVSSIKLSGLSKKIAAGRKVKLTAKISPSNAFNKALTWKSNNPKVATVDDKGVVTMKKGSGGKNVTITATAKDGSKVKATYNITSMKGVVKKITISGISKKIAAGKKLKLTAKITASKNANQTLIWKSSNTKVATVTRKGVVTVKKNTGGKTAIITASATDGSGKKASYKITSMKGIVKKVVISGKKTRAVKVGKTLKLKARVTASNSTKANKKLKWASSNPKYASVSSAGRVKAKKAGKGKRVTITARATDGSNKKAFVKIKIR